MSRPRGCILGHERNLNSTIQMRPHKQKILNVLNCFINSSPLLLLSFNCCSKKQIKDFNGLTLSQPLTPGKEGICMGGF